MGYFLDTYVKYIPCYCETFHLACQGNGSPLMALYDLTAADSLKHNVEI